MQPTKKTKEGPASLRQISKQVPKESSRDVRHPSPVQAFSDEEDPWFGITLNRCLLVAVVIIVISSSIQCLNEALEPFWSEDNGTGLLEGHPDITADNAEEQQQESSLWDSLFSWNRAPEDSDDDTGQEERPQKQQAREKGTSRGEFVRVRHRDKPPKGHFIEREDDVFRGKREKGGRRGEKEEPFKGKRDRRRED